MIQVQCKTKKIGNFGMQNINFEIPDGYIVGLIGENGAGKTTLLHLILGLYQPDIGEIRMDGKLYHDAEKEIRQKIGTVLQERLFEEERTLQQNADFYGKYYQNYDVELFRQYSKRFGLDVNAKYKRLSKGEELKFQFAYALSHQPKWLILDEPTGNFDPEFRKEFLGLLKEFIADGQHTVILTTHLTDDLDRIADYIIYLEHGNLILCSDIESIRENYRIVSGDAYKVKLFPKEFVVHMEESEFGAKALIHHRRRFSYEGLSVVIPTIEELMYFIAKRSRDVKKSME